MLRIIFILFLLIATQHGCKSSREEYDGNSTSNSESSIAGDDNNETEDEEGFPDDRYSAEVEYYNPNTGRRSTYSLEVEVEDNTVTVIYFNNGGWLDETHIVSGGELDEDGSTTIYSDKGYEYIITINK